MVISQIGVEAEGGFDTSNSEYECDESECYRCTGCGYTESECACNDCRNCNICDSNIDYCECESCRYCDNCDTQVESCNCECRHNILYNDCQSCMQDTHIYCDDIYTQCEDLEHNCQCYNGEPDITNGIFKEDGSVHTSLYDGEAVSNPGDVRFVNMFLRENYPDEVNDTCGMHVHLSFTNYFDYMTLCDEKFHDSVLRSLKIFMTKHNLQDTELPNRMAGVYYAQRQYNGLSQQLDPYGSDRYTTVNYSSFKKHNTIELRVLPMFDNIEDGIKAIRWYYRFVQRYLQNNYISLDGTIVKELEW